MKNFILIAAILCLVFCVAEATAQKRKAPAKKPAKTPVIRTAPEELLLETKQQEAFKGGPVDSDGWSLYESKEDLFKLAFPPTPVKTDSINNAGKKDGNRYYDPEPVTGVRISLTMTVLPLGVASLDSDFKRKVYQAWAAGVLAADGGERKTVKVSEKEFAFEGSFGLEVIADHGEFRFHGRIVCPADKCYQYDVGSGTPEALKPEEAVLVKKWTEKFFDSFQLTRPDQPK